MRVQPKQALQRRRFDMIKQSVPVADLARDLIEENAGRLTENPRYLRGQCPVCLNGNHSKALSVSLEKNLWYCFACGEGGDVIDLANLAGKFESPVFAAAWIGHRYGIELPERPECWYRKQSRQERLREELRKHRVEVKRRRLFRTVMVPVVEAYTGADELKDEMKRSWKEFQKIPGGLLE